MEETEEEQEKREKQRDGEKRRLWYRDAHMEWEIKEGWGGRGGMEGVAEV